MDVISKIVSEGSAVTMLLDRETRVEPSNTLLAPKLIAKSGDVLAFVYLHADVWALCAYKCGTTVKKMPHYERLPGWAFKQYESL